MEIKLILNTKDFSLLKGDWNQLLEKSTSSSTFLTWEWLYTWWQIYGENRKLLIVCLFKEDHLAAIFPLISRNISEVGVVKTPILEFLGTGEDEKDEVCSNLMEPIVHPDYTNDIYSAMFTFLINDKSQKWDQLIFRDVRLDSLFTKAVHDFFPANDFIVTEVNKKINAASTLNGGWETFFSSLGRRTRKKTRRERRWLEAQEGFKYKWLKDENELDEMFDAFIELSLKRRQGGGACASKKFVNFLRQVSLEYFRKGLLKFSLMYIGETLVAGNLDFCFKDTVYGYQTSFDPTYNPQIGIGMQGMLYGVENAADDGYGKYDWYGFAEGSYKEHFVNWTQDIATILVKKKTSKNLILNGMKNMRENLKKTLKPK